MLLCTIWDCMVENLSFQPGFVSGIRYTFLFFVAPIPVIKFRKREKKGSNVFYNTGDLNDKAVFFDENTINPGPLDSCLKGGRV